MSRLWCVALAAMMAATACRSSHTAVSDKELEAASRSMVSVVSDTAARAAYTAQSIADTVRVTGAVVARVDIERDSVGRAVSYRLKASGWSAECRKMAGSAVNAEQVAHQTGVADSVIDKRERSRQTRELVTQGGWFSPWVLVLAALVIFVVSVNYRKR